MIKKFLPKPLKKLARKLIKLVRYTYRYYRLKSAIKNADQIKIILGAAETAQDGWYSTNEQWLDITNKDHWDRLFKDRNIISHAAAEHVFEHLTYDEGVKALRYLGAHMTPGARVRIAVPDGYHPDPEYIRHVGIGGIGDDASDHKQLLNADVLMKLVEEGGFKPTLVEGYTQSGDLIQMPYSTGDGLIRRSRAYQKIHGQDKPWAFPDADTSLIVDGIRG